MTTLRSPDIPGAGRARWLWLVAPACILAAITASVTAAPHLPERMPTRWGFDGEPTNLMPRGFALSVLPAIMLWVGFLTSVIGWSARQSRGGEDLPAWVSPAIMALISAFLLTIHLGVIALGMGWGMSVPLLTNVAVGLLYVGIGVAMPKVPPNPLFGVRTARTLACPDAWERANRIGGRWLVGAGIATILAAPLPGQWPFLVLVGSVLVAFVASLAASRRTPDDAGAALAAESGLRSDPNAGPSAE
jgi:uncharacterized membrane protein